MKAVTCRRYGPPDVLALEDVDVPVPADDEHLIRVRASEVTKADTEMRAFRFAVKWFWLPMRIGLGVRAPRRPILGSYFSGEIETPARTDERFAAGDAVFGCAGLKLGTHAEYVTLPARYTIVPKPANMSFEEAAAVPLGGLNALHFMNIAAPAPGERVLINGAGGSIGAHAVMIAKDRGAHVTAVDAGHKAGFLERLGAERFVDYRHEDVTQIGERFDVVFDMVAASRYGRLVSLLEPGGRYVKGNPRLSDMLRSVATTRLTRRSALFRFARESREELCELKNLIEAGLIGSIVDRCYPMNEAAEAHRRVESEQRVGAVVLTMDALR